MRPSETGQDENDDNGDDKAQRLFIFLPFRDCVCECDALSMESVESEREAANCDNTIRYATLMLSKSPPGLVP